MTPLPQSVIEASPKPDDECDICGKTLRQHNMGHGYPMCGIYAVFRRKPAATQANPDAVEAVALCARLRIKAKQVSEIQRGMAEAKSLRQAGHEPPRKDLYMWPTPEQTDEWKAADMIAAMQPMLIERERALREAAQTVVDRRTGLVPGYRSPPLDDALDDLATALRTGHDGIVQVEEGERP